MLKHFLSNLTFQSLSSHQEDVYHQLKSPFIKDFFKALCGCLTLFFIPLTVRYYMKNLYPQTYIGIGLVGIALIIFILRNRLQNFAQVISIIYISIVVVLAIYNSRLVIAHSSTEEAFYMGYSVSLMTRLMDFRVSKFHIVLIFTIIFTILKFCLIITTSVELIIIILILETFPIVLSFLSERSDRLLFGSLHRSKTQLLKFKQLLTEYLPNPMVIFAAGKADVHFFNEAFRSLFGSKGTCEVMTALDSLVLERSNTEENKGLFRILGHKEGSETINLSQIMELIAAKKDLIKNLKVLSFQVVEQSSQQASFTRNPTIDRKEDLKRQMTGNLETRQMFNQSMSMLDQKSQVREETQENNPEEKLTSKRRVFKVKLFPLAWDNEEAIALVIDDVTHERTIMELKVADKNKDLVIAMVSHELRTPLNGMLGLLEIMKAKVMHPKASSYLDACKSNGRLLLNLVNSILDFSQISNNKLKLNYSRVSIGDLLAEIKSLFDHFCIIKDLYLNVEIDPNVPETIVTDQTRLSQIIVNLLGNAFKFTFKGGVTLRVTLQEENPCRVMFSVEDTGIGIKKEDQGKLFKLFGRLEQQDRSINTHGVGLGLTISNDLVLTLNQPDNKGIQVESKVGKGTKFSFSIKSEDINEPLESQERSSCNFEEDRDSSIQVYEKLATYSDTKDIQGSYIIPFSQFDSKERSSSFARQGNPKYSHANSGDSLVLNSKNDLQNPSTFALRNEEYQSEMSHYQSDISLPWCLIVDDNPFNLMVAMSIMKEKGYRTITAMNGQDAITKAKEHQASSEKLRLILMDCQMPVMDGYEATRMLRKMIKEGEVRECDIVALTANNHDEDHEKLCKDAGMNGTLAKPLKVKELEEILQKMQKGKDQSRKRSRETV